MYMTSSSTNTGFCSITVTFEIGRDPDLAAVDVQNRVNQALGRMPADVRTNGITVTKNTAGFLGAIGFYLDATTATTSCSSATTSTCTCATRSGACPGSATSSSSASASSRCGSGSIRTGWPRRGLTAARRRRRAARAERAGGRRQRRRGAGRRPIRCTRSASAPRAGSTRSPSSRTSSSRRARDGALVRVQRHRPRRARRRELLVASAVRRRRGVGHRHHAPADGQRARHVPTASRPRSSASRRTSRRASRRRSRSTTSASSASRSSKC